jgi:tetratricopeptide (TPR) repeat protein
MSKPTPAPIRRPAARRAVRVSAAACWLALQASPAQLRAQDKAPEASAEPAPKTEAATPSPSPPPAALQHYERGRAHYLAGRYREALQELEQAMRLDPSSPNLVFNVARVYELLGEIDHAIAFYKRYRDMLPADELAERERTTQTLQRLEGARNEVVDEPVTPAAPPELERGVADRAFWSVLGVGAVTLAGAGATGLLALNEEREADDFRLGKDGTDKRRQQLVQRAERLALASDTMALVGTTFVITAVLLYAVRQRPVANTNAGGLDVKLSGHGAFLSWTGTL